ncbi:MAG: acyl-CoA/acyl-ACP dehydrogenase [Rhodobiaceae bacterium]|nr:acyl-CoA/acyl-ACP dehydrogenase [Rhodobiaceae bacterium]
MRFIQTEDQMAIHNAIESIMRRFPDEYWMKKDQDHEFPWEFHEAIAQSGFLGTCVPEEYGGAGLGLREAAIILAGVAGASGGCLNATSVFQHSIWGMEPVVKFGSDEMKQKYLPPLITGELMVCFGVTEPDAGTDLTSLKTTATREGDHYIIKGKKVWTSKAQQSSKCLLITRSTPLEQCRKKTDGMSLFLVDLDPKYVHIRPIPKMGRNAISSCEVFYDSLPVPVSDRIGEEGRGFHYLLDGLNSERILIAVQAIAIGRAAIRKAVQYAKDRVVFGRPIGQNQGVQFPLADSVARLDAAELMTLKALDQYDAGEPCGDTANMAKYLASEAAFEACDRAVQTHGGYGYASEFHVERYFRETRIWRFAPIANNFILSYIAEKMLGLPRSY